MKELRGELTWAEGHKSSDEKDPPKSKHMSEKKTHILINHCEILKLHEKREDSKRFQRWMKIRGDFQIRLEN